MLPGPRRALAVQLALAICAGWGYAADGASADIAALLAAGDVRPGLCVYVGCTDGALTAALHCEGKFLVHGLAPDGAALEEMRKTIRSAGLYGRVSVEHHACERLPYADNTVNVIVVDEFGAMKRNGLALKEVLRALAPYGAAFLHGIGIADVRKEIGDRDADTPTVREIEGWIRIDKPYPEAMDDWNQYAHDPARTFVSRDTLAGPLESIRWIAGEVLYTGRYVSPNLISAGGRVFLLYKDRGYTGCVEGRDAFNGCFLWRTSAQEGVKDFAADGQRLYVLKNSLEAWDAATGKPLFKFQHPPAGWHRLLLDERAGVIVLLSSHGQWAMGFEAATGKELWQLDGLTRGYRSGLGVIGEGRLYYSCQQEEGQGDARRVTYLVRAADIRTGRQVFEVGDVFGDAQTAPTISQYLDGKVIVAAPPAKEPNLRNIRRTDVLSAENGRSLWSTTTDQGIVRSGGFFHLKQLFWTRQGKAMVGFDPDTGEIKERIEPGKGERVHGGCDPMVATANYFIGGRMHFIDPVSRKFYLHSATRTPCRDSCRVANGLVYFPRHTCACANQMNGNIAISHTSVVPAKPEPENAPERFHKGPAYGAAPAETSMSDGWPTYRANAYRGGVVSAQAPSTLAVRWSARIGTTASAPVAVGGRVYAAAVDEHSVVALEAGDGREAWRYVTGGRVDSPPTIHRGFVLFGSRDGWVYCLRAADGELVWRFRAAPDERRIVVHEQLESIWPVFGALLVDKGLVYASAGRHVDIDGGLWIYALEPATGRVVWHQNVRNPAYKVESAISSRLRGEGAINDILRSDGRHLYIAGSFQKMAFDLETGERVRQPERVDLADLRRRHGEGAAAVKLEAERGKGAPIHSFAGPGFLTDWLILGPFPGKGLATDHLAATGGEADARLTPGMTVPYKQPDGAPGEARVVEAKGDPNTGLVRPQDPDMVGMDRTAYAFCWVRSREAQLVRGIYGASGGEKIWINGTLVCRRQEQRRIYQEAQDIFPVPLKKGLNAVLVKVQAGGQGLAFFLGLTDTPADPVLSTAGDMLLPAGNRALGGHWGDPTNASVIWVFDPDQERVGIPFHHKGERFDLVDEWGYGADLMVFDGYRVFGVGREHDAERTKLAAFGKPSWQSDVWFADLPHDVAQLRAMLVAGDVVVTAFGRIRNAEDGNAGPQGTLRLFSAADGRRLGQLALPFVPRWDGMAAADGKLFLATECGRVLCLAAPGSPTPSTPGRP